MSTEQEIENAKNRIKAEEMVEAFFSLMETKYGLKPEDIPEIVDDMRWLRKHRAGLSRVSWSVVLGILALVASGLWEAFVNGLKAMVQR